MRNTIFLASAAAAIILSGAAVAGEPAAPVYRIAMSLHDGATLVASPTLEVESGEQAAVVIDDGTGHSYEVRLRPSAANSGTVYVVSSINVAAGANRYSATPALLVALGQKSSIQIGKQSEPFRVDFEVTEAAGR